jgi:hypothetical protein
MILRAGLRPLVVGKDGRCYEKEEWHTSNTFWQGDQQNLLVADNQTNDYQNGSAERRLFLSRYAWGENAAPSAPQPESVAATGKLPTLGWTGQRISNDLRDE